MDKMTKAREIVTEWLGMFDPPPQIDFQQSEILQHGIAAALAAKPAAPVGEPVAWQACDARYAAIDGIVTTKKSTVDAWRESGIKFNALPAPPPCTQPAEPVGEKWTPEKINAWARNWHWQDTAEDKPVDPSIYYRDGRMLRAFLAALSTNTGEQK